MKEGDDTSMVSTVRSELQAPELFSEPEKPELLHFGLFGLFGPFGAHDKTIVTTFERTHIEAKSIHIWLRYDKNWEIIILSCTIECGCSNLHICTCE